MSATDGVESTWECVVGIDQLWRAPDGVEYDVIFVEKKGYDAKVSLSSGRAHREVRASSMCGREKGWSRVPDDGSEVTSVFKGDRTALGIG